MPLTKEQFYVNSWRKMIKSEVWKQIRAKSLIKDNGEILIIEIYKKDRNKIFEID